MANGNIKQFLYVFNNKTVVTALLALWQASSGSAKIQSKYLLFKTRNYPHVE